MSVRRLVNLMLVTLVALCGVGTAQAPANNGPTYLDQGWNDTQRQQFYTTTQGSQLIPLSWFLALERPDTEELFLSDGLTRFGFLPNGKSPANPNGLPVGFTVDNNGGQWAGVTCAACHTNQIKFHVTTMQIDGGPTDADLYTFLSQLSLALRATLESDAKFSRFANKVGGSDAKAQSDLKNEVTRFSAYFSTLVTALTPQYTWGPARADAFGLIFNRAAAIDLSDAVVWQWFHSMEQNNRVPNAPVSYPFLWGTSRQDKVQWNGIAPNTDEYLRLERNIVEALGAFARINLNTPTILHPEYVSTVNANNQLMMEESLIKFLKSPQWPEAILGAIDKAKAAQGQALYQTYCASCHLVVDRDGTSPVKVKLVPLADIATDPLMTTNVACREAESGVLTGSRQPPFIGHKLAATDYVLNVTENAGIGVFEAWLLGAKPVKSTAEIEMRTQPSAPKTEKAQRLFQAATSEPGSGCMVNIEVYRARSLDGIWATAPYLHNGSVPNLYQLLLPGDHRVKEFFVGSRTFDPVNVGFESTAGSFKFDTSLAGNSNKGHEYGTKVLTEEQRQELLEYLKTL
jgi:cytochrome c553